ncbi:MAG TPA: hypothetical protein VMS31_15525 [Pyrinomonadaceae bacterium]|nr:hypothetical protein [Pyrinomonadaceae bacterium]
MNLDNARGLKASLMENVTESFAEVTAVRSLGIRSQKSDPGKDALRTMAIGICGKGKQHQLAIRLQRRSMEDHPMLAKIRKQAKGEVDIKYVGKILKLETAAQLQKRRRPLVIGCSIGHFKITAGTLGCFVRDRTTGETLILSNNHVLANENNAAAGDAIIQPGDVDGGKKSTDTIGALRSFVRLKKTGTNFVDCAVASIKNGIKFNQQKLGTFGKLAGLGLEVVVDGTEVRKVGRTTGQTKGRVTAFELDNVVVEYDIGNIKFDDQIEIEGAGSKSFSDGGDSGSLIIDKDRGAVALLFAGGDQGGSNNKGLTYGNPIRAVLDALKVDLLT